MTRPRRTQSLDYADEPMLHSGVLFKRGYGRLLGRKTWKPRYFVLTRSTLRYYKFEHGQLRDEIDLTRCTEAAFEVMPADLRKRGRSRASIWRIALQVPQGQRLIMAAPTEFEMNVWIKHIRTVLRALAQMTSSSPNHDETKEAEERVAEPPIDNQSEAFDAADRPATAAWKPTATNFQNFVAQPRRSMIFRRQSFEGLPIVPGVYRYSTGQIDDAELQKELDELRADLAVTESRKAQDDAMDDEEEEALVEALREFSRARLESIRVDMEDKMEGSSIGVCTSTVEENQDEDLGSDPPIPFGPIKPIFHYRKEETPVDTNVASSEKCGEGDVQADKTKWWFARVSRKLQRSTKLFSSQVSNLPTGASSFEDSDSNLPEHFRHDPATAKPRRFSTGSMRFISDNLDFIPNESKQVDGLVDTSSSKASVHTCDGASSRDQTVTVDIQDTEMRPASVPTDGHDDSNENTPIEDGSSPNTAPGKTTKTRTVPTLVTTVQDSDEAWLSGFKTKWRARRNEKKQRKCAPGPPQQEDPKTTANKSVDIAGCGVDSEVAAVLSDMIESVTRVVTSELEKMASNLTVFTEPLEDLRVVDTVETTAPLAQHKRSIFRRWRDKRRHKRETRLRRLSTGDMMPVIGDGAIGLDESITRDQPTTLSVVPQTIATPSQAESTRDAPEEDNLSDIQHFSARFRRSLCKSPRLIELEQVGNVNVGQTTTTREDESDEEVVVVVVRRRHSLGSSENQDPSCRQRPKRIKYRVYLDVGDDNHIEESDRLSCTTPYLMTAPPAQPTRVCAA